MSKGNNHGEWKQGQHSGPASQPPPVVYEYGQSWVAGDGGVYAYAPPMTRVCTKCRINFQWDGSEFKTLCLSCYSADVRKCNTCKSNNLRIGAPSWQTDCIECYLKKKKAKFGTCPKCPPEKAQLLSRPLDKPTCMECAHRLVFLPMNQFPIVNQ